MKTDVGVRVRMSAEISASCTIESEVMGQQAFLSIADGAVALHFTDEQAFKNFMREAMNVLAQVGLNSGEAAVRKS